MSKNNYDQFNLPPTGPNLCDFYGQYIGFGGGGPTGVQLTSIAKSALFDSANDEDLSRGSMSGTATTWTASFWVFRGDNGQRGSSTAKMMFTTASDAGLSFGDNSTADVLAWYSGSYTSTTRLFRDTAWYHMVVKNVAGTGTVYVNGQPVLDGLTVPTADATMAIGSYNNSSSYLDGYMAEWVFIDGTAHQPTTFAEYDPTGTFWVPKSPTVIKALTFGTNGFYLDNATNAQTDAGSEGNNFTNNNTVLTSSHTPTNLNALFNPLNLLDITTRFPVVTVGNTTTALSTSGSSATGGLTFPVTYNTHIEFIFSVAAASGFDHQYPTFKVFPFNGPYTALVQQPSGNFNNDAGLAAGATKPNFANNDRITMEIDAANGRIYLWQNGNALNSANPASNSGFTFDYTPPASGAVILAFTNGNSTSKTLVNSNPADFEDTVSTGYFPLTSTAITAQTTRTKSDLSEYFETSVYEGNGFGQTIGRHLPFTNSYTVAKSGLFQLVATGQNAGNDSLQRDIGSAGTSTQKFTFSFWFKLSHGHADMSTNSYIFNNDATDYSGIIFDSGNKLNFLYQDDPVNTVEIDMPIFDQSKWYHAVLAVDTTESTALDRVIWYLDGVRQAVTVTNQIGQNENISVAADVTHSWGSFIASSAPRLPFDGYLAEIVYNNNIQDVPGSFGETDAATGAWVPKSLSGMSFEATGYYLNFATLGADVSGNSNTFTSSGVTQVNDSPTTNFGTLLNNKNASEVLTNGNRSARGVSGQSYFCLPSGLRMTTEKIFVALRMDDGADGSSQVNVSFGCHPPNANIDSGVGPVTDSYAGIDRQGGAFRVYNNQYDDALISASTESHTISAADTDVITMAVDPSDPHNGKVWFGVYDTSEDSHQYIPNAVGGTAGDPALGTLPTIDGINFKGPTNPLGEWRIFTGGYRHTAAGTILVDSTDIPITIPSGFLEFKQSNIKKGRTIATGASADEITPSYTTAWSWLKNRDAADSHMMFDRVRGVAKDLHTDATAVEVTDPNTMYQFLRGGVRLMDDVQVNTQKESYVAWNWYFENTGSGSSNTDGSINTTSTLVDTNLGMSISTYSGTGSNATVGHGLAVAPEFIIIKNRDVTDPWAVYYGDNTDYMVLNTTASTVDDATMWQDTTPTSSVWSIGTNHQVNADGENYIAYCFAPSQFSAIGSYEGSANANGTFVPTVNSLGIPIQPKFILQRNVDGAFHWQMYDTTRDPFNPVTHDMYANASTAETNAVQPDNTLDIVTGGFKCRGTGDPNRVNTSVFLAFGTPIIDTSGRIITGR